MNTSQFDAQDPVPAGEPAGAERYLMPGEELRICSSDIQIKKFRFEAYLTNRRFFLIDQNDPKPGVTAKEIPVDAILSSYLEESPAREPVIVLSVRTAEDDIRTMKMTFAHAGEDRASEAEEWVHLIAHATPGTIGAPAQERTGEARERAAISQEARALSDTIVFPTPKEVPPRERSPSGAAALQPEKQAPLAAAPQVKGPAAPAQIMFCFHCGKKLPPLANFCPFCGTKVHQTHEEASVSHLHLPLHQYQEAEPEETSRKGGWRRLFGR
ncbi:MAG: zinc ribbon domain-containing protein [Methanomicrobiales archaeon]|nr:zinc ribbon domain-containing protein [Methanomicrobiales archaeon]